MHPAHDAGRTARRAHGAGLPAFGRPFRSRCEKIKRYLINPVEAREAGLGAVETLRMEYEVPSSVSTENTDCGSVLSNRSMK